MGDAYTRYEEATAAVRAAEEAWVKAETDLIQAKRAQREAWDGYYKEVFPTKEALREYFAPPVTNGD